MTTIKNNRRIDMSTIEEEIRKALEEEDQQALAQIDDEAGLFEIVGMSFHGKQAWLTWYMWAMGFITFVIGVYCFSAIQGDQ
jgi:NADH dehydrogenase FAD-containing subunit